MDTNRLLSTAEAAHQLGLDPGTLKRWRTKGATSPLPYVKVSANRCRYTLEALRAFMQARTRNHTADPGPAGRAA
jgi:predicted site-specific integrase-resolvase